MSIVFFAAILLSQFEQSKLQSITIEAYEQLCDKQRDLVIKQTLDSAAESAKRTTDSSLSNRILATSQKLAEAYRKEPVHKFDPRLSAGSLSVGKIGILASWHREAEDKFPAVVVTSILSDREFIATVGGKPVHFAGVSTEDFVDDQEVYLPGIFVVRGRYKIGSRTLPSLGVWENEDKWLDKLALEKEKTKLEKK